MSPARFATSDADFRWVIEDDDDDDDDDPEDARFPHISSTASFVKSLQDHLKIGWIVTEVTYDEVHLFHPGGYRFVKELTHRRFRKLAAG